jgi:hypothetical protein
MNLTLIGAVVSLVLWGTLVFAADLGSGLVHLLYGVGTILIARRIVTGAPKFLS